MGLWWYKGYLRSRRHRRGSTRRYRKGSISDRCRLVVVLVTLLVAPGMMDLERNTPGLALGLGGVHLMLGSVPAQEWC